MPVEIANLPAVRVTNRPGYHFFGYYDKSPWDHEDHYMLALEVGFMHRPPRPEDKARIGFIDPEEGYKFTPVAETYAWNWQQGCMLQWMPNKRRKVIIYNDRAGGRFISVVRDIESGEVYTLPSPIYTLSHDGRKALTLNFARLARTRPGYGYVGVPDPWATKKAPREDGVYLLDLESGDRELIISIGDMVEYKHRPDMDEAVHWFNHLLFSPDDKRFIFLHRWSFRPEKQKKTGLPRMTRLLTADVNGGDIYLLADDDLVSHFDWRDPEHILAWARKRGVGDHYILFTDKSEEFEVIGRDVLTADGHCSYSPDRRWILTDTGLDRKNMRRLLLYNPEEGRLIEIGRFYSIPELRGEIRCDLHPRWSRDGTRVCIDSTHEGERQMYVIDVGEIVK